MRQAPRLSGRERRVLARMERELEADGGRSSPVGLLVVGLLALVAGAIAMSEPVLVAGVALSLGALLRAGVSS